MSVSPAPPVPRRRWLAPALAAGATALLVAGLFWVAGGESAEARLTVTPASQERGGEVSPVYSPDGKSFVYQIQRGTDRRLMLRTQGASTPVELAAGLRLQLGPNGVTFWSPDGTRVYFDRDRTLWQVGVSGGQAAKVIDDISAAEMMPDGQTIVLLRRGAIYTSQLGAEPRLILEAAKIPGSPFSLHASPDGTKLAITGAFGVWVMPLPNGPLRQVFETGARTPTWHRDSRHLLVSSFRLRDITWVDTETGSRKVVHAMGPLLNGHSLRPDGGAIVYSSGVSSLDIREFSMDGHQDGDLAASASEEMNGRWSDDGSYLVYTSRAGGEVYIRVRSAGSGSVRSIHQTPQAGRPVYPVPSPDGKRIAFENEGVVWTIPAQGGLPQKVSETGRFARAQWSPDGAWIWTGTAKIPSVGGSPVATGKGALVAWTPDGMYYSDGGHLWRESAQGGPRTDLGVADLGVGSSTSPDGRWLYSLLPGGRLVVRDLRTGAVAKEIMIRTDAFVRHVSVHPDGKRMAVTLEDLQNDLWVLEGFPVPEIGWKRIFRKWVYPKTPPAAGSRDTE